MPSQGGGRLIGYGRLKEKVEVYLGACSRGALKRSWAVIQIITAIVDNHRRRMIINSCQKDVEVFCVALVTYKLTKIYENNDPSAK